MAESDEERLTRLARAKDVARWRWRTELVRQGKAREAGLEVGDVVRVLVCDDRGGGPPAVGMEA